jgi:hypothetical protein
MPRAKYVHLMKNPDVKRWFDNTARGSRITADVCLRRLGSFCKAHKITPKEFAALPDKELHDMLLDYVSARANVILRFAEQLNLGYFIQAFKFQKSQNHKL